MKHKDALLVLLAYIIGLNTSFIAFGLNDTTKSFYSAKSTSYVPAVNVELQGTDVYEDDATNIVSDTDLVTNDAGLFVTIGGEERVISQRVLGNTASLIGAHVAVHATSKSPSNKFVHYCEQETEIPTTCSHYIYIAENHSVARVMFDGQHLQSEISTVNAYWTGDQLVIGSKASQDPATPWYVE